MLNCTPPAVVSVVTHFPILTKLISSSEVGLPLLNSIGNLDSLSPIFYLIVFTIIMDMLLKTKNGAISHFIKITVVLTMIILNNCHITS